MAAPGRPRRPASNEKEGPAACGEALPDSWAVPGFLDGCRAQTPPVMPRAMMSVSMPAPEVLAVETFSWNFTSWPWM